MIKQPLAFERIISYHHPLTLYLFIYLFICLFWNLKKHWGSGHLHLLNCFLAILQTSWLFWKGCSMSNQNLGSWENSSSHWKLKLEGSSLWQAQDFPIFICAAYQAIVSLLQLHYLIHVVLMLVLKVCKAHFCISLPWGRLLNSSDRRYLRGYAKIKEEKRLVPFWVFFPVSSLFVSASSLQWWSLPVEAAESGL